MTAEGAAPSDLEKLRVGIVLGTTRPGRRGEQVAKWVHGIANQRTDATFELVDLADYALPLLDEPVPPSAHKYSRPHTTRWAEKIGSLDAFVIVTPEYNHSTSASLKNAIDFLYAEWNNKVVGFVSYGSAGGIRAVEHLRQIFAEVEVATVKAQAWFSLANDFENWTTFKPSSGKDQAVTKMLDQLVKWGRALRSVRA